ncbi:hypothetical protein HAX54_052291 [Datura stramonium]|uniref:Uncharacterized protein n=1 Tax=Datura stramonium TaxID=4076 RepID=A0ABS8SYS4_DATST|nr:hypothetical protein [Datura stramonium]
MSYNFLRQWWSLESDIVEKDDRRVDKSLIARRAVTCSIKSGSLKKLLDGLGSDSEEESGNEATSSPTREPEPLRGDVLKAKTLEFRDISSSLINIFKRNSPHRKRTSQEEYF